MKKEGLLIHNKCYDLKLNNYSIIKSQLYDEGYNIDEFCFYSINDLIQSKFDFEKYDTIFSYGGDKTLSNCIFFNKNNIPICPLINTENSIIKDKFNIEGSVLQQINHLNERETINSNIPFLNNIPFFMGFGMGSFFSSSFIHSDFYRSDFYNDINVNFGLKNIMENTFEKRKIVFFVDGKKIETYYSLIFVFNDNNVLNLNSSRLDLNDKKFNVVVFSSNSSLEFAKDLFLLRRGICSKNVKLYTGNKIDISFEINTFCLDTWIDNSIVTLNNLKNSIYFNNDIKLMVPKVRKK